MSGERWGSEVFELELLTEHIAEAIKEFPEEVRPLVLTYIHIMESLCEATNKMNYYVSGDIGEDDLKTALQKQLEAIKSALSNNNQS